jgi:hypothetical protein
MQPLANIRLDSAMAEEFENYEARAAEARRAVERWEAEGAAQEGERQPEQIPEFPPSGCEKVPAS